jgi:hypothetical protein
MNTHDRIPISHTKKGNTMLTKLETKRRMKELEESLTGGYKHGVWHFLFRKVDDSEQMVEEAVLFFMDVEYDPVRVTYQGEGCINIHADGNAWVCLSDKQLEFLADKVREVEALHAAWRDGADNAVRKAFGAPESFDE